MVGLPPGLLSPDQMSRAQLQPHELIRAILKMDVLFLQADSLNSAAAREIESNRPDSQSVLVHLRGRSLCWVFGK